MIIIINHEGGCNDTDQDGHRTCINVEFDTQIKAFMFEVWGARMMVKQMILGRNFWTKATLRVKVW